MTPGEERHTERRLEVAARCEFASPGPWYTTEVEECDGNVCIKHAHHDLYRFEADVKVTAQVPGFGAAEVSSREVNVGCFLGEETDARFIAHARTDVEWLLARLKESDAALLAARAETETLLRYVDHLEGCPTRDGYYGKSCSCGLTDTLAALAATPEEKPKVIDLMKVLTDSLKQAAATPERDTR